MKCPFRKVTKYELIKGLSSRGDMIIPKESITTEEFADCIGIECAAWRDAKDSKGYCAKILLMPD